MSETMTTVTYRHHAENTCPCTVVNDQSLLVANKLGRKANVAAATFRLKIVGPSWAAAYEVE